VVAIHQDLIAPSADAHELRRELAHSLITIG